MDPGEAGQEVIEDQPSIRDDSEDLVSETHIEISPVNLDNAPNPSPVQPTVVTTPSTSIFRFLSRPTNLNPNVTDHSRRVTSVEPPITPSREALLVNLREETEAAELRSKLALADEATALQWLAGILSSWTLKLWNWTASATYYESRDLPLLNSRVRPGQQPVCPLPRLTFSGDSWQFYSQWNKPGAQICRWLGNGLSGRKLATQLR